VAHQRAAPRRGPGRPVDTDIEDRVYAEALQVYAETGWAGFTIHAVATRSKVGKAAIYRRWESKEDLIADTMMRLHTGRQVPDTGSLRGDLVETACNELDTYLHPAGLALLRAQVEAKIYPELFGAAMERWRVYRLESGREIVLRAVARGELASGVDGVLLLDAVGGMIINHYIATPVGRMSTLSTKGRELAERIADFALSAVGATAGGPEAG
jgi:AcrR family transcriptional regulator